MGAAGLGSLASCASGSGDDIAFWHFIVPGTPNYDKWLLPLIKDFNARHKVKVRERYIPFGDYANGPTLQTAFSAGDGPDVFMLSPGDFVRYYNANALADLTPHLSDAVRADYEPAALASRTFNDRVYGLPMEAEPLALFYSHKAFEAANLSEGDLPKTWDELLDVAQKLTGADRFGLGLETSPGYYQNFTWYPFMWMGGGSPIASDQIHSTFDSKAATAALRLWQQTIDLGVAPTKLRGGGGTDTRSNLLTGFCAMQQTGIWAVGEMKLNAPKFEYGVLPLPTPPGGKQLTVAGGWALAANAKGSKPDAAAQFITYALGSEDPACVKRGRLWNTVIKKNLPVRKSVRDLARRKGDFDDPIYQQFLKDIAPTAKGEPRYPVEIYRAISDALQACQLDGANVKDAAADASEQIATFLSDYKGGSIL
jgi:multiple sugar transport system substrate-binding protein